MDEILMWLIILRVDQFIDKKYLIFFERDKEWNLFYFSSANVHFQIFCNDAKYLFPPFILATVKENILRLWARDEWYTDPYQR